MQFPPELQLIINAFAKPMLQHSGEYKRALAATNRLLWSALKRKLSSPEADQVVKVLRDYLESKTQAQTFLTIYKANVYENPACELSSEERDKMRTDWINSIHTELRLRRELDTLIA
jgi:hypothetical protein